jgi:hypothetical protein
MPEGSMAPTDEDMQPDEPEELSREDEVDARPSEEFPKVALDAGGILNDDHTVQHVLEDEDVPFPEIPQAEEV